MKPNIINENTTKTHDLKLFQDVNESPKMMYVEQDINSISQMDGEITDHEARHLRLLNEAYQKGMLAEEESKAKSNTPVVEYHEDYL